MAYEVGLAIVNEIQDSGSELARQIVNSLRDRKVSPMEYVVLAAAGVRLAAAIVGILSAATPEEHKEVLYVLEHMKVVLDEEVV